MWRRSWRLLGAVAVLAGCDGSASVDELSQASTQQCPTQTVEGVDVYGGDGTITWSQVQSSGRVFAFMKATQGNYNTQTTFNANWTNSKAAGLLRSPYHFFDGTIDGVAQATWFLDEVTQAGGIGPGDLPPMLDIECPTSSVQASAQSNCEHTGDSGWAPTATLVQRAFDWLATVEAATGMRPIIYSYPAWFAGVGFNNPRLANYPLFIATYATCATVPAPWTRATFWQYSASGKVPGIGGGTVNVDVDRFMGTAAELTAYVASDIDADAGIRSGGGGGDLATAPPDLATARDLATVVDLGRAPDLRADAGVAKASADSGCSCQLGGHEATPRAAWGLALLALSRRQRRRRRVNRAVAVGEARRALPVEGERHAPPSID